MPGETLRFACLRLYVLFLLVCHCCSCWPGENAARFGVLAKRGVEQCTEMWGPTADYLTSHVPSVSFELVPLDFDEVLPAVGRGDVDFVLANSSFYVRMEVEYGVQRIVTLKNLRLGRPYTSFGGVIFSRADRYDIEDLYDLHGKSFMAVDQTSFGGWQMAWRELEEHGIDAARDLASLQFGGTHDAVVYAVRDGDVDAGTVRTDTLERMEAEGKIDVKTFRVLHPQETEGFPFVHSTRLYPEWPIGKVAHTSDELAEEAAVALFHMPPESPAARAAKCAGWTIPHNYEPVHDCLRILRIEPYQDFGKVHFADVVRQHWHWLLTILCLLFVLSAITVHALRLNRQLSRSQASLQNELQQRMRVEEELREATRVADDANRAKTRFLAAMSHEIRTPMNAIINMAALTLETDLNHKQRQYLNVVNSSARSLLALINDILDFSKIEAGKIDLEAAPFRLGSLLEEVTVTFRDRVIEKNVELIVNTALDVPRVVIGDSLRLRQILVNLIGNAFKFTEKGEVVLRVTVADPGELPQPPAEGRVGIQFSVRDTGIGIPAEKQKLLFEAFTQADSSTSRRYGGTGLGLAICQRLVSLMGGSGMRLESEPGVGSEFSFVLPFVFSPEEDKLAIALPAEIAQLRTLIVEDNVTSRELLETILNSLEMEHEATGTAEEALEVLKRHNGFDGGVVSEPVGLVLMDWRLPGMDGLIATERIRADEATKELPVIVTSAFTGEDEMVQGERIGVSAFLHKPITPSSLYDTIVEVCGVRVPGRKKRREARLVEEREFEGVRLLVAEDNEANRFVAKVILERAGIMLDFVENGKEAVEKAGQSEYAAILMDVQMPAMDGLEATRAIRRAESEAGEGRRIPIIAMTAEAIKGDDEKCFAAGMDDYIPKPIDRTHLFRTLRKWIPEEVRAAAKEQAAAETSEASVETAAERRSDSVEVPEIEGVEVELALRRLHLPYDVLERMLVRFAEGQVETLEKVREAVAGMDYEGTRLHAHSLAGAAGNVGATKLREVSKALELAARAGEERIAELLEPVAAEAEKVFSSIREVCGGKSEAGGPAAEGGVVDVAEFVERLRRLEQPLADLDFDGVSGAMEEIRKAGIPEEARKDFGELEKSIDNYDYERAAEAAWKLVAKLGG